MAVVRMKTTMGDLLLELDPNTPVTTENFLAYVNQGHYDGTIFHRVIDNFMIQGGGFDAQMNQKDTNEQIDNEADKGQKNVYGSIAMARTNDPHSATAQFFINVKDNDFLNYQASTPTGWGYCVFGKVIEGMDVVENIKTVNTTTRSGHADVPVENIEIISATVEEA